MTGVSVITASLPSRRMYLDQAVWSIGNQESLRPLEHLVGIDHARRGTGAVKTALARAACGDWIATLDDDDLAYPFHLATLVEHSDDADIVWSWCDVANRAGWSPNADAFDPDRLRAGNYIPATALIRAELVRQLDGWRDSAACDHGFEDWDFWLRALDLGARFRLVPEATWSYRFHGGNKTFLGERGAR